MLVFLGDGFEVTALATTSLALARDLGVGAIHAPGLARAIREPLLCSSRMSPAPTRDARFADLQRQHFEAADSEQFRWITGAPGVAESEAELLEPLLADLASPCLEIGCGEGANLLHLTRRATCFGVDLSAAKLRFAAHELPTRGLAGLAAADAARLPFADAAFASVFVRDVLHHVVDPDAVLSEAMRVLRPRGAFCLLEPNGRNPLIGLQTLLVPAEIGARDSNPTTLGERLRRLPLSDLVLETAQPLALRRTLLHYRFGAPSLGRAALPARALAGLEAALGGLMPRRRWTYVVARARRA